MHGIQVRYDKETLQIVDNTLNIIACDKFTLNYLSKLVRTTRTIICNKLYY